MLAFVIIGIQSAIMVFFTWTYKPVLDGYIGFVGEFWADFILKKWDFLFPPPLPSTSLAWPEIGIVSLNILSVSDKLISLQLKSLYVTVDLVSTTLGAFLAEWIFWKCNFWNYFFTKFFLAVVPINCTVFCTGKKVTSKKVKQASTVVDVLFLVLFSLELVIHRSSRAGVQLPSSILS